MNSLKISISPFIIIMLLALNIYSLFAQAPAARYKIYPDPVNAKPVSPLIYGNFIEMGFGRQIEGLWAEKLNNSSFEEVSPYKTTGGLIKWIRKLPGEDLSKEEWWHSGYEEFKWYATLQNGQEAQLTYSRYNNFHHGLQAALLNNTQSQLRAYLAQDGIWLDKGTGYRFSGYMSNNRSGNLTSTPVLVTIGLYPEKDFAHPVMEKTLTIQPGGFKDYSLELNPVNFSGRASFAVSIEAGANVWFDGFSLMPLNSEKGWRKEVIVSLKQIGVPIIRFPGGCFASFYHWRDGIGPRQERIPVNSEFWGGLVENSVGTAEFIEFCRMIGSQPFLCINMLTGSASEAAEWVAYCNAGIEDRNGILRKEHGFPEPFRVKYWELDNETYRKFGYEDYALKCVEYSKAMKSVDPGIQLVMVGYGWFNMNLKEMLDIAGPHIDLITDRAGSESTLKKDLRIIAEYNKLHGTKIRLCNTEWMAPLIGLGATAEALRLRQSQREMTRQEHQITWNYALNTAFQLLTFQRIGGEFEFSNFNNLANTWGQNIIECPKEKVFISAVGRVFEMMSKSQAAWILKTDTLTNLKGIYTQSAISGDKKNLIIYLLNYLPSQPEISFDLSAFNPDAKEANIKTLFAEGPLSANTYLRPNQIKSSGQKIRIRNSKKPVFTLLPWSLTEITISL
jgi:alpha-N-arabinofuranosidase